MLVIIARIIRTKETVGKILNDGGSVILMSHLGRPKGEVNDKYSLRHIVGKVSEILGQEVVFAGDVLDENAVNLAYDIIKDNIYQKEGKLYGMKVFPNVITKKESPQ